MNSPLPTDCPTISPLLRTHCAAAEAGEHSRHSSRRAAMAFAVVGAGLILPGAASAHVEWFTAYDVAEQPRGLENLLCPDFEQLIGLALAVLLIGCVVEGTPVGTALLRALDRATAGIRANTELLIRVVCGAFFVALWTTGGILLTPELKTASPAVPWLQLAIAAGLIWRRTLPFSALGIIALFGLAVRDYGFSHLVDYPIFLGIAAYLALTGLQRTLFGIRPLDIARGAAGVTLMWVSIENWGSPEWSFPLFINQPAMSMGNSVESFTRAAGVIEFTLAFALVWTPLVRRSAAIILASMFVSAVLQSGPLDAIGHSAIIVVLLATAADDGSTRATRWKPLLAPVAYGVVLAGYLVGLLRHAHDPVPDGSALTRPRLAVA